MPVSTAHNHDRNALDQVILNARGTHGHSADHPLNDHSGINLVGRPPTPGRGEDPTEGPNIPRQTQNLSLRNGGPNTGESPNLVPLTQRTRQPHPSLNRDEAPQYAPERELEAQNRRGRPKTKVKTTRATLTVATLNIRGGGSTTTMMKWQNVNQILREKRIGVLAVQETHLKEDAILSIHNQFSTRVHIRNSNDGEQTASKGIAFVLNKQLTAWKEAKTTELIPGRAILLSLPWQKITTITILAVYAPNQPAENGNFWKTLTEKWIETRLPKPDVMLGDFNMVEEAMDRLPAHADATTSVLNLRTLKESHMLTDGWRKFHGSTLAYSFKQTATQARSRIDRIYITDEMYKSSRDWEIESSGIRTDHYLVSVKLANPQAPYIGKGRWAIPPFALENRKIIQKILSKGRDMQNDINDMLNQEADRRSPRDVQRRFHKFKEDITAEIREYTRTEVPRMEARIRKAKEDLKSILNDPDPNEHLKQMAAHEKESLIENLEAQRHTKIRDNVAIKHKLEGECLTKYWINANKERTPRDTIPRLNFVGNDSMQTDGVQQYTNRSDEMAKLARDYHEELQNHELTENIPRERAEEVLSNLDTELGNTEKHGLAEFITEDEVNMAIRNLPKGKAPGLDGIPHELWQKLAKRHSDDAKANRESLNIARILCLVYNDIERNGVDESTGFASGWMCPIYKKGDRNEISNYRPITVLNSDYKIMTRVLTTRLSKIAPSLIHPDQAGFMTGRKIEDQTDLTRLMIDRCEATEENGAIVCLDQEKAYDKIRHDFIWLSLEKFNFPKHFIDTVRALYEDGKTCVVINGVLSDFYQVIRGVRQGDPLSCLIFNLAIESLASMLRKSNLIGFQIPGCNDPLITTLFADDTTVYMKEGDNYSILLRILEDWCRVSGAKFNTAKTAIIPVGTKEYRQRLITTRRLSETQGEVPDGTRIAKDGEVVRVLGTYVGNETDQPGIWTPTLEKLDKRLAKWQQGHPTQNGKRLIISMEVGGLTQYLTRVQGMPKPVEELITKRISKFFWGGTQPTVNLATLGNPVQKGGKDILNIADRNEAIDIMRLKTYLKPKEERPRWTFVADELIKKNITHHPHKVHELSVRNIFMQSWKTRSRGATSLTESLQRLIKTASKYNVGAGEDKPSYRTLVGMPMWHHVGVEPNAKQRNNDIWADCQRQNHGVTKVEDMLRYTSGTLPGNHENISGCRCWTCEKRRNEGCLNPHKCRLAGMATLDTLSPYWDPRKVPAENPPYVRMESEFDKRRTESTSIEDSFRIFRGERVPPTQLTNIDDTNQTDEQDTKVYIVSTVTNRGEEDQSAKAAVFYGKHDPKNRIVTTRNDESQTRQAAEIAAIAHIIMNTPPEQNIVIHFETKATPNLLIHRRPKWEKMGWATHPCGTQTRALIQKLQTRRGRTRLVQQHDDQTEETSEARDLLNQPEGSQEQARAEEPTREQDMGAKLQDLSQTSAYRLIQKSKGPTTMRRAARTHLDIIRHAIKDINGKTPNDETMWKAMKNPIYSHRHKAFVWRAVHNSYKIGTYWDGITNLENRGTCPVCEVPETMDHILTECRASGQSAVWKECERVWNLRAPPAWIRPTLGTILGSSLPRLKTGEGRPLPGASRLYTILISESAQLIWRTRCKWRISDNSDPNKKATDDYVTKTWQNTINRRIHLEALQTNTFKYGHKALKRPLVDKTWRGVLKDSEHVRDDWISSLGGLVGIG